MTVTRFEGTGPVAQYWLAHCEGFAVEGGTRGVVEELMHDDNPHLTSRLLVRTRRGRTRLIPVGAVTTVSPAERTLVVREPRPAPKPERQRTWSRRARLVVAHARPLVHAAVDKARPRLRGAVAAVWPVAHAAAVVLRGSFRRLATELRATADGLRRSAQAPTLRLPRRPRKRP